MSIAMQANIDKDQTHFSSVKMNSTKRRMKKHLPWLALVAQLFIATNVQTQLTDASKTQTWKVIGPGGGGGVMLPTISPFNENIVLTHCDMTGAYISYNAGNDWRMFNLWTVPEDFEFDPMNENTIYTATRGYRYSEDRGSGLSILYRSEDKGKHWRIIYPDISKAKKIDHLQNKDLLPSQIVEGAFDGTIDKVEVDRIDNKKIYLGFAPLKSYLGGDKTTTIDSVMIIASPDYGKNWRLIAKAPGQHVKAIFTGSKNTIKNELVVFTESSCTRINEQTGKTTVLALPVKKINAADGGNDIIYIESEFKNENGTIKGGMYASKDRGTTWVQVNNGLLKGLAANSLPYLRESGFAACENKPEVAYLSTIHPMNDGNGKVEEVYCVFKTSNGGKDWSPVLLSSTQRGYITNNFIGSWMEKSYDPGWGGNPIDLGVAPNNPDVCYAGDNGRGYKTVDGGKNWQQVYSKNRPDSSYASNGLDVTTCYGIHFDPFDKNHFFICYTDMGLFHTFNGGESWFHSNKGIPRDWLNTCYQVEFDPKIKGRVWSAWANAHDLPRTKMFERSGFDNFQGGVAVSDDGGRSWKTIDAGIPANAICTNILLDSTSSVDARILYVSVFDKGIYKSTDGGMSWQKKNSGLGENLYAWEIRRNADGRLFVLCSRGKRNDQTVDGVIYYSDDKAETWHQLKLPDGINGPHDLLIDPVRTNIMYVSCWPNNNDNKDAHGGVIRTEDGGKTWKQVFDESIRVNAAGMDPAQPNKIYINTFQNAAYRSDDYGTTWKRIEGYRFKWGQKAVPDINHPEMLFLSSYGGSVFYGPADGIPGAFEDIENMPGGWW